MSMGFFKYQGTHNPYLMNPSTVKYYSQQNPQNPDFDLPLTQQPFELSNTMTNFDQFFESSCQNPINFQTSDIPFLQLHNDRNSKTQRIKIYLEALLNSSHSQKSKLLALSRSTHSVFHEPPVQNHEIVPIAPSISTFPPQAPFSGAKTRATISTFISDFQCITSNIK